MPPQWIESINATTHATHTTGQVQPSPPVESFHCALQGTGLEGRSRRPPVAYAGLAKQRNWQEWEEEEEGATLCQPSTIEFQA